MKKLILPILLLVSSQMFALRLELGASSLHVKAFQINGEKFWVGHGIDKHYHTPKCERLNKILKSGELSFEGYYFKDEVKPRMFKKSVTIKPLDNIKEIEIDHFQYEHIGKTEPAVKLEIEYKDGNKEVKEKLNLEEIAVK